MQTLSVELRGELSADVLDLSFTYRGETLGATLEAAAAREGHCATRSHLLDTALRYPDGWFDVPLSDRHLTPDSVRKALALILREHFDDDLAAYHLILTP